jgi:hypothetical protein
LGSHYWAHLQALQDEHHVLYTKNSQEPKEDKRKQVLEGSMVRTAKLFLKSYCKVHVVKDWGMQPLQPVKVSTAAVDAAAAPAAAAAADTQAFAATPDYSAPVAVWDALLGAEEKEQVLQQRYLGKDIYIEWSANSRSISFSEYLKRFLHVYQDWLVNPRNLAFSEYLGRHLSAIQPQVRQTEVVLAPKREPKVSDKIFERLYPDVHHGWLTDPCGMTFSEYLQRHLECILADHDVLVQWRASPHVRGKVLCFAEFIERYKEALTRWEVSNIRDYDAEEFQTKNKRQDREPEDDLASRLFRSGHVSLPVTLANLADPDKSQVAFRNTQGVAQIEKDEYRDFWAWFYGKRLFEDEKVVGDLRSLAELESELFNSYVSSVKPHFSINFRSWLESRSSGDDFYGTYPRPVRLFICCFVVLMNE